jgi:predicted ester cyclase
MCCNALGIAMSTESNKALIRCYFDEVWNKGNLAAVHTYCGRGLAEYNEVWVPMWRTALPDVQMWLDAMIAEGNTVAVHMTLRGTHLGELTGELIRDFMAPLPPTGRHVEAAAMVVYEIADDRIVRVPYAVMDWLTLLRQLGAASAHG